jgi:4'-phosphopantetheinyl transferase EntD
MPIFYQQELSEDTKLGIWKIEEDEDFFLSHVMAQRNVSHPHKQLQHLAGRYLLKFLFPDFPIGLIQIADTRKPFLENEAFHFSISHCGDYAAAIVSKSKRVGVDIEIPSVKILKIEHKFLHDQERIMVDNWCGPDRTQMLTLLWSIKEAMFKWWGRGEVDFSEMLRVWGEAPVSNGQLNANFNKGGVSISFAAVYKYFPQLVLTWVATDDKVLR